MDTKIREDDFGQKDALEAAKLLELEGLDLDSVYEKHYEGVHEIVANRCLLCGEPPSDDPADDEHEFVSCPFCLEEKLDLEIGGNKTKDWSSRLREKQ